MKIALSLLSGLSYGAVTYFRNLIPALARQDKSNQYHIFLPAGHELLTQVNQNNFVFHEVHFDPRLSFLRHFWEQFVLPFEIKRCNIDILFTAKNANVLFAPCKTVISIRNMEPLCFERYKNDWKLNIFSWLRRINTMISARKADRIIAVSEAVQKRLTELIPRVENKIDIIYNGNSIPRRDMEPPGEEARENFLLSASKFVAYANQLNLVRAYCLLRERGQDLPPLWFAGGVHDKIYFEKVAKEVREKYLEDKIRFLGLVAHEELLELYCRAHAFIFPSTLEACPHTLIEAMTCGVPVATSHTPPMPEICGEGAVYFDPMNIQDMAEKIDLVVRDENLRETLKRLGRERGGFFDWDRTASSLIQVFKKVSQQPSRKMV